MSDRLTLHKMVEFSGKMERELNAVKKELETKTVELAEAQQWIDSEPDWKDKYNANYKKLETELEQTKAKLDSAIMALKDIRQNQPAQEGGNLFYETFDLDGNYTGIQNVDPLFVIQEMVETAAKSLEQIEESKD